ncbi:hypothetical protein D9V80_02330 [Buchnera aphidicola (Thelaxes californica)]|uniref:Uncharacterized protein n=1 Tax=Buchnera aphidicola (Thelaxes californica) TaxID=1315998 RepID=A0A4D6YC96_9GAMM|nr:hypothetical protein [Buchnera aphidicola]QCI26969.1 hypothetical protein D9V80_02330 [Buchnera aphidicola (Thelaxes californica)]
MTSFTSLPNDISKLDFSNIEKTYYDFEIIKNEFKDSLIPPDNAVSNNIHDTAKNSTVIALFPKEKSVVYSKRIPKINHNIDLNKIEIQSNNQYCEKENDKLKNIVPINSVDPSYPLKIRALEHSRHNAWTLSDIVESYHKNKNPRKKYDTTPLVNSLQSKSFLSFDIIHLKKNNVFPNLHKRKDSSITNSNNLKRIKVVQKNVNKNTVDTNIFTNITNSINNLFIDFIQKNTNADSFFSSMSLINNNSAPIKALSLLQHSFDDLGKEYHNSDYSHLQVPQKKYSNVQFDSRRDFIKNIISNLNKYNDNEIASDHPHNVIIWHSLNHLQSDHSVHDLKRAYQDTYEILNKTMQVHDTFLSNFENEYFQINGKDMNSSKIQNFTKDFMQTVPDLELQQLISVYANQNLFNHAYLSIFLDNPELLDFLPKHPVFHYKIDIIDPQTIKIVGVNTGILEKKYSNNQLKTVLFGVKTNVIVSKNDAPKIEYSYFIK